jgi:TRAP-type C4-dicarboxylate transport system permease small subunit
MDLPDQEVPAWLQFTGLILRSVFILALMVLTFRVALPQNETISTAYDTPNDLVRLVLGFAVCGWLLFQLFKTPHDSAGYRTWFYLGLVVVPFTVICLAYVW